MRTRTKDPDGFIDGARRDRCAIVAEAVRECRAVEVTRECWGLVRCWHVAGLRQCLTLVRDAPNNGGTQPWSAIKTAGARTDTRYFCRASVTRHYALF
jgi:hypothetical protein